MSHSSSSSSNSTCLSAMLWNWYTIDSCFLAESWHVQSNGAFAASCIGTVLLAMLLEAMRRLAREYDEWIQRGLQARAAPSSNKAGGRERAAVVVVVRASPLQQLVRAVLHAVALGLAYILMLVAMSFNGYVIVCIVVGGGLGKFFCDWMAATLVVVRDDDDNAAAGGGGSDGADCCCS